MSPWWGLALRGLTLAAALAFLVRGVRWQDMTDTLRRAGFLLPSIVIGEPVLRNCPVVGSNSFAVPSRITKMSPVPSSVHVPTPPTGSCADTTGVNVPGVPVAVGEGVSVGIAGDDAGKTVALLTAADGAVVGTEPAQPMTVIASARHNAGLPRRRRSRVTCPTRR